MANTAQIVTSAFVLGVLAIEAYVANMFLHPIWVGFLVAMTGGTVVAVNKLAGDSSSGSSTERYAKRSKGARQSNED